MSWKRFIVIGLLLLWPCRQSLAVNPDTALLQYAHTAWRLQDGLLSAPPTAIAQTSDGYIWIGTRSGLLRFDGVTFTPWQAPAGQPQVQGFVVSLLGASDGSLWIGTDSGIARWDGRRLVSYPDLKASITAISEGPHGDIWFARARQPDRKGSLCEVRALKVRCIGASEGNPIPFAASLAVDSTGAVWLGGATSVFRYGNNNADSRSMRVPSLKNVNLPSGISALSADHRGGGVWVAFPYAGPGLGLEYLHDGRFSPPRLLGLDPESLKINTIFTDSSNALWVGTSNDGLYRITGDHVEHYTTSEGLSSDEADAFLEDREGNIWVVTSKGIDRFRDLSVITYSMQQGLSSDDVAAVLANRDGSIWSMSYDTIDALKNGVVSRLGLRLPPGTKRVESIFQDRDGRVWVGVDNGLYVINDGRFLPVLRSDRKPLGYVFDIAQDTEGTVWVAALGSADNLYRVDPSTRVAQPADVQFPGDPVQRIIPDVRAGVWANTTTGVVVHLRRRDGRDVVENRIRTPARQVGAILQGTDGTVYVWSPAGLLLIRGNQSRWLGGIAGDPCLRVYSGIFDQAGSMWVASACGLTRFTKDEISGWWEDPKLPNRDRLTLGPSDGFSMSARPFQPTSVMSSDGRLWFATVNGLLMLGPRHLVLNRVRPPVHVSGFFADHHALSTLGPISVPPKTHDVEIDYAALSFSIPQKVLFRYQLERKDKTWQSVGTRRQAFYTDLDPGHYTFRVIARNDSGLWNEQGATLGFTVLPAWYQTLWFRIMTVVVVLGMFWSFYRNRLARLQREMDSRFEVRMTERMRIARELHDTLLQSLQGLVLSFSSFSARVTATPEVREEMERFLERADHLVISGRERIRDLRGEPTNAGDLTAALSAVVGETFGDCGPKFNVKVEGAPRPLHEVIQEEAVWIVREALANARQHSGADEVKLLVSFHEEEFRISVEDNGRGFGSDAALASPEGHFGLTGMQERAQIIGGRLSVHSAPAKGTFVGLSVPGRIAYKEKQGWLRRLSLIAFAWKHKAHEQE